MNMTRSPYANEWAEALRQILAEAWDLLRGSTLKEQCPSSCDPESDPDSTAGKDQLLLPGIAEPHRWKLGRKGSH